MFINRDLIRKTCSGTKYLDYIRFAIKKQNKYNIPLPETKIDNLLLNETDVPLKVGNIISVDCATDGISYTGKLTCISDEKISMHQFDCEERKFFSEEIDILQNEIESVSFTHAIATLAREYLKTA